MTATGFRKRTVVILGLAMLTVLLIPPGTVRQGWAADGVGDLRFWSDYAAFRLKPGAPEGYVEFYFEMKRIDFTFRRDGDRLQANVHTWVDVSDSLGRPVDSIGGVFACVVRDSVERSDSNFTVFFARVLVLPPGHYQARTVVTDLTNKASAEAHFPVVVPDFSGKQLTLSGIELGYNIIDLSADSDAVRTDVLVKNGQKVYPDCRGITGIDRPRLLFYTEVYNLDFDAARDNSYQMQLSIVPTDSTPARSFSIQKLTKPGQTAVLASGVNVNGMAPGIYNLKISVTDPASGQIASTRKRFYTVAPPTDSLTPEEQQRIRDIISYIALPEELATFERLNAVGKRNFWFKFWKDRDPTPGTPENEFKEEHLRRMNYANERFSIGSENRTNGWQTDMGRVYIIYGPPDNVERFPFTAERPAAEQWFYDNLRNQGQVYFLFIDENGYGEYNLVHSTARGERRDPKWDRQVREGYFEHTR